MSWAWYSGWWGTFWEHVSSGPWWSCSPSPRSSSGSWWVRPRFLAPTTSRHMGRSGFRRGNEVMQEGVTPLVGFSGSGVTSGRSRRLTGGEEMPIADTRELLLHELRVLYDAEHRFLEGQVQMVHRATDSELQRSIEDHIYQTRRHVQNLEQFFGELGQEPRRETNEAARGLVSEARQDLEEARNDALRDCVINTAVIKVEHLEMGSYRGLITRARLMMGRSVQQVAVKLDDGASSHHESVLLRPQRKDRRCCTPARDVKGSSRPHLRGRSHLSKTLREAPRRREAS